MRDARFFGAIAALIAASAGCSASTVPVPRGTEFTALGPNDVPAILKGLAETRGLAAQRPVDVKFLSRTELDRTYVGMRNKREDEWRYQAFLAGFDLFPPSAERARTSPAELRRRNFEAFYSVREKTVFVPDEVPLTTIQQAAARAVLAHELHHALQAQHFAQPVLENSDQGLAWSSLLEGDANVAAAAYVATSMGIPPRRALYRLRNRVDEPPRMSPGASPELKSAWDNASPLTLRVQLFPYREGAAFVVDLYRAGGFPLVNAAYTRPPVSSEQILHPQKYLEGEVPRPIGDLTPPEGWTAERADRLGEIGVRVFLQRCLKEDVATRAAEGWNGDRGFVLSRGNDLTIGWVAAWDSEADADQMEGALVQASACLKENDAGGFRIAAPISVRREGSVVAFARGGELGDRTALLPALLALAGEAPPRRPVSSARIPEMVQPTPPREGVIQQGHFFNDYLGIWTDLPEGATASLDEEGVVVEVRGRGVGQLGLHTGQATVPWIPTILDDVGSTLAAVGAFEQGQELVHEHDGEVATKIGPGYTRLWRSVPGGTLHEATVIPVCGNAGALVVVVDYAPGYLNNPIHDWLESLQWITPGRQPDVCGYLDPQ